MDHLFFCPLTGVSLETRYNTSYVHISYHCIPIYLSSHCHVQLPVHPFLLQFIPWLQSASGQRDKEDSP